MELWVRGQDKTILCKIRELYIGDRCEVLGRYYGMDKWDVLGVYDTKERCLEILDEIQKILQADPLPLLAFTNCDITQDIYNDLNKSYKNGDLLVLSVPSLQGNVRVCEKSTTVYEMPEK